MVNSVSVQTIELLYSALLGLGLGVLFDIIRVARTYTKKSRIIYAAFDTLFWILAIISLLAFVLTVTDGEMRWYVLLGVFCGAFVYMSSLSGIVFKVILSLLKVIQRTLGLITRPLYLLLGGIWRGIKKTEKSAERKLRDRRKRKGEKNGKGKEKRKKEHIS